ncbi:MAG: flagellar basal-body rod protein FlgG [Pseudomonadota bacterium]
MQALKIAATGMAAQQTRVDVTSNNIANMSTTAYDRRRAAFADLFYQQLRAPGALSATSGERVPVGVELGLGTRVDAVIVDQAQGALRATGASLDLAIQGEGFFEINLPDGNSAYTRDGSFQRSAEGVIVTDAGFPLAGDITIPIEAESVQIAADGTVSAIFQDDGRTEEIGQIDLVRFVSPAGLSALGDTLFAETEASGPPAIDRPGVDGRGTLRQGFLEDSAVDVVREITDLIEAQRGYELNARVMSAADEMLSAAVRVR